MVGWIKLVVHNRDDAPEAGGCALVAVKLCGFYMSVIGVVIDYSRLLFLISF